MSTADAITDRPPTATSPPSSRYIVSPRVDAALLVVPLLASLAALTFVARVPDPLPLPLFLLLVVAFDVAHVWTTLYLGYLDREAFARRKALFVLTPIIAFVVGFRLHLASPVLFWTLLAYVAIHHFASQQWGFVALYKAKAGEREPTDRSIDKWTVWTGALGPVLLWHTSDAAFDWFGHGEAFLLRLDPSLRPDIVIGMAVVAAVWLGRQAWHLAKGTLVPGKVAWVVATWLSWSVGLAWSEHQVVALACINLLHGIPFLVLVAARMRSRWRDAPAVGAPLGATLARSLPLFYGLVLALACGEEWLWEGLVWHSRTGPLLGFELGDLARAAVVAALAVPQVTHYYLDAWLWRLDGSNPDLADAFGLRRASG